MPNAFPLQASCISRAEGSAVTTAHSPDCLPVVLLFADVRFEPEMPCLITDRAFQFLVCGTAFNALVRSIRQDPDKCREDGLPHDASTACVMIIRG